MKPKERMFKINAEIGNVRIFISVIGGLFYHDEVNSPTHSHSGFEFHIMLGGESSISTETKNIFVKRNQACIIAPNVIHTCTPGENKHLKCTFSFSFEKLKKKSEKDMYEIFTSTFGKIEDVHKLGDAGDYIEKLNKIIDAMSSERKFSNYEISLYFSLIMLSLLNDLSKEINSPSSDSNADSHAENNIRRIMIEDYVNANYSEEINLKTLAESLFLSTKQTSRIFKKEMGMSFTDFVMKIRLESAQFYLKNTNLPIREIADKVGYRTYNGFYKLFVDNLGMTPIQYRHCTQEEKEHENDN